MWWLYDTKWHHTKKKWNIISSDIVEYVFLREIIAVNVHAESQGQGILHNQHINKDEFKIKNEKKHMWLTTRQSILK